MIHEEICTYEVCKLAKEKGFPQHITEEAYIVENYGEDECNIGDRLPISLVPDYMDDVAAPTQSLLQRWLREEKNIHISVEYEWVSEIAEWIFNVHIKKIKKEEGIDKMTMSCYSTYELALENAVKYALENLV